MVVAVVVLGCLFVRGILPFDGERHRGRGRVRFASGVRDVLRVHGAYVGGHHAHRYAAAAAILLSRRQPLHTRAQALVHGLSDRRAHQRLAEAPRADRGLGHSHPRRLGASIGGGACPGGVAGALIPRVPLGATHRVACCWYWPSWYH